jgi:hypothetical protein
MDEQIILRCDALFRLPGVSAGTDREVAFASKNGIPVLTTFDQALEFKHLWERSNGKVQMNSADDWTVPNYELDKIEFCKAFSKLAVELGKNADEKGFWTAHRRQAEEALKAAGYGSDLGSDVRDVLDILEKAGVIGDPVIYLSLEICEIAEAIEAFRQRPINWHEKGGVWEEQVDLSIRLIDWVVRFGKMGGLTPYGFAEKIYEKHAINQKRPPLHGKRF